MPIVYHYDQTADIVRIDATGDVTALEIQAYFEAVVREPWWRPGLRYLADNRGITTPATSGALQTGALAAARTSAYQGGARVAVLVDSPIAYGLVRQFDALITEAGGVMVPFYHDAEAAAWLRGPPGVMDAQG